MGRPASCNPCASNVTEISCASTYPAIARSWSVPGISLGNFVSNCPACAAFGNSDQLEFVGQCASASEGGYCFWASALAVSCPGGYGSVGGVKWALFLPIAPPDHAGFYARLYAGMPSVSSCIDSPAMAFYSLASPFSPLGSNVLAGAGEFPNCTGWPSTITISPA